jgi:hypothetical protein
VRGVELTYEREKQRLFGRIPARRRFTGALGWQKGSSAEEEGGVPLYCERESGGDRKEGGGGTRWQPCRSGGGLVSDTKRRQLGGSGLAHAGVRHGGGGGGGPVLTARGCGGGEQRSAKGKGSHTLGGLVQEGFRGPVARSAGCYGPTR